MPITKYRFRPASYSPWRDLEVAQNRLAGLFDSPLASRTSWTPSVNVSETKDGLELTADLPGLSQDDLTIELENNVLTISGERTEQVAARSRCRAPSAATTSRPRSRTEY